MQNFSERSIQVRSIFLVFRVYFSADEYILCIKSFCIPFREQKSNSISAINGTGSCKLLAHNYTKTHKNKSKFTNKNIWNYVNWNIDCGVIPMHMDVKLFGTKSRSPYGPSAKSRTVISELPVL